MYLAEIRKRLDKLTRKDDQLRLAKAVEDIKTWFAECQAQYNAPEAVRQRREEYNEVQRIGELRRAAFCRNEPMIRYPLPWETIRKNEKEKIL